MRTVLSSPHAVRVGWGRVWVWAPSPTDRRHFLLLAVLVLLALSPRRVCWLADRRAYVGSDKMGLIAVSRKWAPTEASRGLLKELGRGRLLSLGWHFLSICVPGRHASAV